VKKKNYKGRCVKRTIAKSKKVCRTYDDIAFRYLYMLQEREDVEEIKCNVAIDLLELGEYTTDFVCVKTDGDLLDEYPSIHQFRYFYRKHKSLQNFYISRNGIKDYQRNNRPLLGDGVQEFAPNVGVGMLDSTVCDIYLVNNEGCLIGRPILTACIDAYSSFCCGYSLTLEGGVYSLRNLMVNVITDKTEHCRRHGISIKKEEWNCSVLPSKLVTDMGKEYACAEAGDGRIIISNGIYMSGNIILKINVNLHIEETGVLLGFPDCVVKNTVSKRLNSYLWCF